jgi:hypothetical protein
MPKVVKTPLRQPSTLKHTMEVVADNRSVDWLPTICCEYKIPPLRLSTTYSEFICLPKAVISQRQDY